MVWFKIDDGFYDHPKFADMSNAAVGLWSRAGAWCARHLTDGVIPDTQVRRFRGTPAQVKALTSAGVWVQCQTESGAKAYRFHDWNDFNPDREAVLNRRESSAERQRKSRERKRQEQQERENVTRDSSVTVTRDSRVAVTPLSQRPDPTRPDPTNTGVEVAASYNVDSGLDDELAAAVDRAVMVRPGSRQGLTTAVTHLVRQGHDTADVVAALKAWQARTDAGPGLLRNLAEDAAAERERAAETDAMRAAMTDCQWCGGRGTVDTTDTSGRPVAVKCDHTTPPARPESTHTAFQPTSDPNTRKALFNALNERTVPQPPF